jgi:hypothetical protein
MIIGIFFFLAGMVVSRMVSEKGVRILNAEEKARFLDAFSRYRMFSSLPVLFVGVLMMVFIYLSPDYSMLFLLGFVLSCVVYLIVLNVMMYVKLKKLNPPAEYRKYHLASRIIQYSGFVAFFLLFGYDMLVNLGYLYLLPFVGR